MEGVIDGIFEVKSIEGGRGSGQLGKGPETNGMVRALEKSALGRRLTPVENLTDLAMIPTQETVFPGIECPRGWRYSTQGTRTSPLIASGYWLEEGKILGNLGGVL